MKIKKSTLGIAFLFIALLFVAHSNEYAGILYYVFKHYDEVFVIIAGFYVALHYHYLKQKKQIVLMWIAFLFVGLLGTAIYRYQSIVVSMMDMVLIISKFMIGYLSTYIFALKHKYRISNKLLFTIKALTIFLFVISLHEMLFPPFYPRGDYRYFAYSLRLMFSHQTYLAAAAITMLIFMAYMSERHKTLPYMLMLTAVAFFSLRSKTIGFLFIFWLLYLYLIVLKKKNYKILVFGSIPAIIYIGADQIMDYFFRNRYSPRQILLKDSISLAVNSFPIGRGFATFGSPLAAQYYSPLYSMLGYQNNVGMSQDYSAFLNDSFWPIILGQFGFIGLAVFLCVIIKFERQISKTIKINKYAGFAMLAILVDMLINSLGESSFFNQASLLIFMMFAVYEVEGQRK